MFILLAGGLLVIVIAVIVAVVSSVVSAVAANEDIED
jgi:ABC-type phosphate transport system permease subunit